MEAQWALWADNRFLQTLAQFIAAVLMTVF